MTRALKDPVGDGTEYPEALYPLRYIIHVEGADISNDYIVNQSSEDNDNYDRKYIEYHDVYDHSGVKQTKPIYTKSQMQKFNTIVAGTIMTPYEYNTVEADQLQATITAHTSANTGEIPRLWVESDIPTLGHHDYLTTGGQAHNVVDTKFGGKYSIERNHLFLDLGHATALFRLHFKVDKRYDRVRKIVLRRVTVQKEGDDGTRIAFGGVPATNTAPADHTAFTNIDGGTPGILLTTDSQLAMYAYMKPSHDYSGNAITWSGATAISKGSRLTFQCTYDIYDNDIESNITAGTLNEDLSAHRTRQGVTATNTATIRTVLDASPVDIKAGHYYDLLITINPDYLYVLSEHDNKHLTIE